METEIQLVRSQIDNSQAVGVETSRVWKASGLSELQTISITATVPGLA